MLNERNDNHVDDAQKTVERYVALVQNELNEIECTHTHTYTKTYTKRRAFIRSLGADDSIVVASFAQKCKPQLPPPKSIIKIETPTW